MWNRMLARWTHYVTFSNNFHVGILCLCFNFNHQHTCVSQNEQKKKQILFKPCTSLCIVACLSFIEQLHIVVLKHLIKNYHGPELPDSDLNSEHYYQAVDHSNLFLSSYLRALLCTIAAVQNQSDECQSSTFQCSGSALRTCARNPLLLETILSLSLFTTLNPRHTPHYHSQLHSTCTSFSVLAFIMLCEKQ